ncbi:MAG: sulfur carrier protein ThiS [Planctomycetaceae bacterium]|nr:sulfur carrier protein ThiS [Planctomycetaceae bacterium]
MQLTINGETRQYATPMTIAELLETMGLKGKFVAVERNREVVSYTKYNAVTLSDGDQLEIVTLVGGG